LRSFSEGLAPAAIRTPENRMFWGYIDKTGKWVIQPRFADAWAFSYGLAPVQAHSEVEGSDKYGYIDKTGKWVIQPRWTFADAFQAAGRIALVQTGNRMGFN
jgi:WG containing repeat